MVGASLPVPVLAPAIDHKLTYRINSSIINNTSRKLPPTRTGVPIGAPLKLKLKLKLKNNSFVLVFRTAIFQKLRTRNRISYGKSSSDNLNFNRGMRNLNWFRCFDIPWSWTSQMISVYLLCLNFVVEAHETPYSSSGYACENVQNYYAGMENLRGEALKKKLNSIVAKHQSLSYKKVWDALKILDAADVDNPEASAEIVEIYSLRIVSKLLAGKPEGWNREHLWPRSYGLINGPSLTDLHNIHPADVNVNSSRRNKFYGECNVNTSDCLKPAARESAPDTVADRGKWAPPVQVRGDIARSIMYMAVCYGFNQSGGGLHLRLSDSPSIVNREMGMLSTLLKWNEVDPPSREEKLRNERICIKYQHNRNPFVDHPEYANLIWKQVI